MVVTPSVDITSVANETHKFFIQSGAFKNKKNADRLVKDLTKQTSQKWFIDNEDDFYKVRLGYFESKESANNFKESLHTVDIAYYVSEIPMETLPGEVQKGSEFAQHKQESAQQTPPEAVVKTEKQATPPMDCDSLNINNGYFVQAGAFAIKSNAEKLAAKLIKETGQNWFIACGKGFLKNGKELYKVRLGYFTSKDEARNIEKSLKPTGIKFYVNKPKGAIIKDQPIKDTEIAAQKPAITQQIPVKEEVKKAEELPVQAPVVLETKTKVTEPVKTPEVKKDIKTPPVKEATPEPAKETVKAVKKTKDGKVIVPPIDDINSAGVPTKFFIQAGAFDSRVHAERLAGDLLQLTLKRWFVAYEDGLYKVRLGYFTNKEAAKFVESTLNTTEVPYYVGGVVPTAKPIELKNDAGSKQQKRKSDKSQDAVPVIVPVPTQDDSKTKKVDETVPETKDTEKTKPARRNALIETPPNDKSGKGLDAHKFFIQAEAFTTRESAEQSAGNLLKITRREWFVVFEDKLYKVRLGYFESKDEALYVQGTLNTPDIHYYIDEIPVE